MSLSLYERDRGNIHDISTPRIEQHPGATPEYALELTDQERVETQWLMDQLPHLEGGIIPDSQEFFQEVKAASDELPRRLRQRLDHFATYGNRWGTLVVSNMPVDSDLPPTPLDGEPVDKPTNYSEYRLLMLLSRNGVPYADIREKKGRLVHQVSPRPGMETAQENGGSSVAFEKHTENVFLPDPMIPGVFALTCIRPGHNGGAPTLTASLENARPYLSDHNLAVLAEPRYQFHFATSYGQPGRVTEPRSVIQHGRMLRVDFADMSLVDGKDLEGGEALARLEQALSQPDVKLAVQWQLGDIALINNAEAIHERTGFQAHFDGNDRWLQRQFSMPPGNFLLTRDLRDSGSHVFTKAL